MLVKSVDGCSKCQMKQVQLSLNLNSCRLQQHIYFKLVISVFNS